MADFNPEIHVINRWPLDAVVASRFRIGPTFILGDAAHRMPPSGGHGLNTAVQDCYNLCWKLASVLRGQADHTLLDSYEVERRPVAERTVASAFSNWAKARSFSAALGSAPIPPRSNDGRACAFTGTEQAPKPTRSADVCATSTAITQPPTIT